MKNLLIVLFCISLIAVSCTNTPQAENTQTEEKVTISAENLISATIDVEGMDCTGCEQAIEGNISSLEGIGEVKASHTDKNVKVSFDKTKTDIAAVKEKITEKGYTIPENTQAE